MPKTIKTTSKKTVAELPSLRSLVALFDLDDDDAVELERFTVQALAEGAAMRFGANPLKSEDFSDDVAVDCEHFETLFLLPRNSVRGLYLKCYAAGLNATSDLFVDPKNGSDENDGLSAKRALRTLAEAARCLPKTLTVRGAPAI
jgi:hypothetical protein